MERKFFECPTCKINVEVKATTQSNKVIYMDLVKQNVKCLFCNTPVVEISESTFDKKYGEYE